MREATSLVLSARLQAAGAHVSAYDPIAEDEARRLMPGLEFADDALGCVRDADAVVLVTEWDEFKDHRPRAGRRGDGGQRRSSTGATRSTRRPCAPPA